MIISRTPHRISLFGGGTDYPSYSREHGGKVLGMAIDKYCYLNVRKLPPFFAHRHRIVYSLTELVNEIDEIKHPSARETLKYLGLRYGLSIHHDGDLPARSGMGSSSAFTVGLLNSLLALEGRLASKEELARTAIHIEQEILKENVGSQDQVFASFGGLNVIEFPAGGDFVVHPLHMDTARRASLEKSLLLVFTGLSRNASEIAEEQIRNTGRNLKVLDEMKALVDRAREVLASPGSGFGDLGALLSETWRLKKSLSDRITTPQIDSIYQTAMNNGATGGKLLGAGGGGFLLFAVNEDERPWLCRALRGHLYLPFQIDHEGSRIIVNEPHYDRRSLQG